MRYERKCMSLPERCATTVEIPRVGPVTIVKSDRARHIRITISPDQTIRLIIPMRESMEKGQQFLHSKVPWILRNLPRVGKLERPQVNLPDSEISVPQACDVLIGRLKEMARIHHFNYRKVSIKNQKTKWGSCSSKNSINLNINLVRLPDQLRDYVILHELAHTRIKNHSKEFWEEMDKAVGGGARELARKLKKYRLARHADGGQAPRPSASLRVNFTEGLGQPI
jgi:predicted metal-dependent hydrolase